MSYLNVVADGVLAKRQVVAMQEFDYEAFNAQAAAFVDQQEHYREIRAAKAKKQQVWKQKKVTKLNKEYAQLLDAWAAEKTFETFCKLEDIEETLVKILG